MKIEDWERTDPSRKRAVWRHDTGVTIMLSPAGMNMYKLVLYDKGGREHFRVHSPNKTKLEHESVKWQKDYNKFLKSDMNKSMHGR